MADHWAFARFQAQFAEFTMRTTGQCVISAEVSASATPRSVAESRFVSPAVRPTF